MKRATVLALLADRDRATAEHLAALQRLDDTTTGGLTVRRLLDGLAAAHVPGSEGAVAECICQPFGWCRGVPWEDVPGEDGTCEACLNQCPKWPCLKSTSHPDWVPTNPEPLVWRKGEVVPEWLVKGVQVRILECAGTAAHNRRKGALVRINGDGDANVELDDDGVCLTATALELVAPVPAAADPDDDAAEWKRRALAAEERIQYALDLRGDVLKHEIKGCTSVACRMAVILRGQS